MERFRHAYVQHGSNVGDAVRALVSRAHREWVASELDTVSNAVGGAQGAVVTRSVCTGGECEARGQGGEGTRCTHRQPCVRLASTVTGHAGRHCASDSWDASFITTGIGLHVGHVPELCLVTLHVA